MRLLTRTASSDGDYDGECTYAVIEIDEELKKLILARRELLQMVQSKDKDINTMSFWDCSVSYYSDLDGLYPLLDGEYAQPEVDDAVGDGQVLRMKEGDLPDDVERTECDQLIISDTVFYWKCFPKHTSLTIMTETATYEELLK